MNTQNQISTFTFAGQNTVRTLADDKGEYWFLANDVCGILGYANSRDTVAKHCKPKGVTKRYTPVCDVAKRDTTSTARKSQEMTYINEPNLYRLIIKSRKPEAEAFEEWVMEEVLPTIRKTGSYSVSNQPAPSPRINEEQYARLVALCVAWSNANPDNGGMTRSHTGVGKALRQMERTAGKPLAEFDIGDYAAALDGMADKILAFRHINARHPFQKMSKGDLAQTLAAITELLPALPPCKSRAAALPPPALKHNDCSIGSLLLGYGSGNPKGGDAEVALQDMAEIQSVFTRLTYAASAEKQLSQKDLQEIKSANDSLNFLSFMVMEAAAEVLKH